MLLNMVKSETFRRCAPTKTLFRGSTDRPQLFEGRRELQRRCRLCHGNRLPAFAHVRSVLVELTIEIESARRLIRVRRLKVRLGMRRMDDPTEHRV